MFWPPEHRNFEIFYSFWPPEHRNSDIFYLFQPPEHRNYEIAIDIDTQSDHETANQSDHETATVVNMILFHARERSTQ